MATKPLTTDAIALTEKKMDMTLDDIIKMAKPNAGKFKKQRTSNKSQRTFGGNQDRSLKVRQYMDSRSTLRQGVLAQRRSNFKGKNLTFAAEAAKKAAAASFRGGPLNRNKAVSWNKPRSGGPMRRGGAFNGVNAQKQPRQQQQQQPRRQQQQQQQQQHPPPRFEMAHNQTPKTLDSLFANMKEQRMRASNHVNNGGAARHGGGAPRQPWLRGRFGSYRS